jgi:prefoldin subunit 5
VSDGEVVEPDTASTRKASQQQPEQASKKSAGGADWIARGLAIVALGVGGTALLTQPDGAALVEADNQLQQQITQLQTQIKSLRSDKAQLAALQKELSALKDTVESLATEVDMLNEKVLNPANEPLVTKGEIELLQKQMQGLQKQLGDWAQRWQKALQGLQSPQAEQGAGEAPLNALQQQLDQLGSRLGELFQAIQPPREQAAPGTSAVAETDTLRLQRWILTVNTEWLMSGNVKLTRERLHALEQAVQMSDLPAESKIRLLRAIGQDLAMLDAWEKQATGQPTELDQLKAWISALEAPRSGDQSADKASQDTDLMARLKGLVEIHKRGEVVPESDRLLAFDLVKQRALVLVDQLAWAQTTHDLALDKRTRARLEALFARYLPDQLPALKAKLAQLPPPKMPQPLHVVEAL